MLVVPCSASRSKSTICSVVQVFFIVVSSTSNHKLDYLTGGRSSARISFIGRIFVGVADSKQTRNCNFALYVINSNLLNRRIVQASVRITIVEQVMDVESSHRKSITQTLFFYCVL